VTAVRADLGYAIGWRLVRALPLSVARALFNAGADRATRGNGPGVQRLRQNLRVVVGPEMAEAELDELVRAGMRSYARYWMEAFRLPSKPVRQQVADFTLENYRVLFDFLDEGNGCVLALPHMGNWDAAGAWVVGSGYRLATVAERLKPEAVFEQFLAYREKLGMEVLPLTGGERPPLDVLAEKLKEGAAVALLADRDLTRNGVEVDFFGGRTKMPPGPALLAIRTGAPLVVIHLWFRDDVRCTGWVDVIEPPTEGTLADRVRATTQMIADAYAKGIAAHPQDWHMLQRLWLKG
jgi:phosphatidylinositol dimannoside acyltransferase